MKSRRFARSRLGRAAGITMVMMVTMIAMLPTLARAASGPPLLVGEEIALARLTEMRTISEAIERLNWPGFDAARVPAVVYEPGAWALAVGFDQPPPGFTLAEGVKDGERQVYRAPAGAFKPPIRSPALVSGKWAVISKFDAPEALPAPGYLGRPSAEEGLAQFAGDAFLIYLAAQRHRATPFSTGIAAWPESAELMALTTMESRAIVTSLQYRDLNEKNIEEYRGKVRQAIAVRRARWKLMGDELASLEKEIESQEGLALYTTTLVHRLSLNQALKPDDLGKVDPTFRDYANGNLLRVLTAHYPLAFTADAPEIPTLLTGYRGAAMGAMLDRMSVEWRPDAVKGGALLVDLLAAKLEMKPGEEPAQLETAKADYHYDALLKLAQDDLARLRQARQEAVGRLFPPGPGTLVVTLAGQGAAPVEAYLDDPRSTVSLGEGRLAHPGGLSLKAGGLELQAAPQEDGGPVRVLTQAGARRDSVKSLILRMEGGMNMTMGGRPIKAGKSIPSITSDKPVEIAAAGVSLKVTSGSLAWRPDGTAELTPVK